VFRSRPIFVRLKVRGLLAGGFAFTVLFTSVAPVAAAAGELDDTFDGNGKLTRNLSNESDFFSDVVVQPDQKIVAVGRHGSDTAGQSDAWVVVRFNPDGSLDTAFADNGFALITVGGPGQYANAVALRDDGTIVVVGLAGGFGGRFGIALINGDGVPVNSFSGDGKTTKNFTSGFDVATDVAIQDDGKMVVSGWSGATDSRFIALRYNLNGSLDSSFNADGIASVNMTTGSDLANTVALDSTGKIVLAGSVSGNGRQIGVARLTTAGNPDTTFSGDGHLIKNLTRKADIAVSSVIQPDDKIVLSGVTNSSTSTNSKMIALRYNVDGTADTSFSTDGRTSIDITAFTDAAYGVALQDDGKVVLAGTANNEFYTVARLESDGTLDTSFGDDGVMFANITPDYDIAYSVAVQADGALLTVGESSGSGGQASAARFLGS